MSETESDLGRTEDISDPEGQDKLELSPEMIQEHQEVYDFLGFKVDLQAESEKGNILLPSEEQQEEAQKQGYTLALIVSPESQRESFIETVKNRFKEEFVEEGKEALGVFTWREADVYFPETKAAREYTSQSNFSLILLKPDAETIQAYPDTAEKSHPECTEILKEEQTKNPQLNLKGLTFNRYLYLQAYRYVHDRAHPDTESISWLLEEKYLGSDQTEFCFNARWTHPENKWTGVTVDWEGPRSRHWKLGARFCIFPK